MKILGYGVSTNPRRAGAETDKGVINETYEIRSHF